MRERKHVVTEVVDGDIALRSVDVDPFDIRYSFAVANHVRPNERVVVRR